MIVIGKKQYVTPLEASEMFAIHISTVYRWCNTGKVKLVDPIELNQESCSKYIIEVESLTEQHTKVHLGVE